MNGPPVFVDDEVLRDAVALAVRAPSIHNTQPWKFRLGYGRIELYADLSRQLPIADDSGRAMFVSCGAALVFARLAVQNAGFAVSTHRTPDPTNPNHLATLSVSGTDTPDPQTAALVAAAAIRRTDRRPFLNRSLDEQTLAVLDAAAVNEGAILQQVTDHYERREVIVAVGLADAVETADRDYQYEMRRWSGRAEGSPDGVPVTAVPHIPQRRSDVELRDFELTAPGTLPVNATGQTERPAMFLLATDGDEPTDRLRAGEALGRVLLTATHLGLAASPYTQPLEVPHTMQLLHRILGDYGQPQILLRIGWPAETSRPPATGRRPIDAVIEQLR